MKNALRLFLVLVLLPCFQSYAQSQTTPGNFFVPVSEAKFAQTQAPRTANTTESLGFLQQLKSKSYISRTDFVQIPQANELKILSAFSLNVGGQAYIAVRDYLDLTGLETYTWAGTLQSAHGTRLGSILLVYHEGFISGSISPDAGDLHYQVDALWNDLYVVSATQVSKLPEEVGEDVPTDGGTPRPSEEGNQASPEASGETTPRGSNSDRLHLAMVAYTYAARRSVGWRIEARINQAVAEANRMYRNSNINLRLDLAYVYETPFRETINGSGQDAADDLDDFRTDPSVGADRWVEKADLVMLMTDAEYVGGNLYGVADQVDAEKDRAYALTEIEWAVSPRYTFTHEFGHLQGARHHPNDRNVSRGFSYGFAHRFRAGSGDRATVMAYTPNNFRRIEHFSSPNVLFQGVPTGIANQRDNARALRTTATRIQNYFPDLRVELSDMYYSYPNQTVSFGPRLLEGGTLPYSYNWRVCLPDGTTCTNGTSRTVTFTAGNEQYYDVYYQVTDADGVYDYDLSILWIEGGGFAAQAEQTEEVAADAELAEELPKTFALKANYPNPFGSATTVRFGLPKAEHARLTVYDVMGRQVAVLMDQALQAGWHTVPFEAGQLPAGVYLYRLETSSFAGSGRMTLVR